MHELSIVTGIIDIAASQAASAGAECIEEIELEIGCLTTVEMDAFEFAWSQGVKGTILDGTVKTVHRIPGKATCMDCPTSFALQHIFDPCPVCGSHWINIEDGKQLRVKSLIVS